MLTSRTFTTSIWSGLLAIGLLGVSGSPQAWAAPGTPVAIPNEANDSQILTSTDLATDDALQTTVSFTAKSMALDELLALLQQQTGLEIRLSPNSAAPKVKVTASIQDLPVYEVLSGLSRLYGVRWAKSGLQTYTLLPNNRNLLETSLMQLGDFNEYENRFLAILRLGPEHMDWPQEVTKHVSAQELRFGAKPKFSVLPNDLANKIRREKEQMAALRLLKMYQMAMEASIDDYVLHAEGPKPPTMSPETDQKSITARPRIFVRDRRGEVLVSLNARPTPPASPTKGNTSKPLPNPKNVPMGR